MRRPGTESTRSCPDMAGRTPPVTGSGREAMVPPVVMTTTFGTNRPCFLPLDGGGLRWGWLVCSSLTGQQRGHRVVLFAGVPLAAGYTGFVSGGLHRFGHFRRNP